MLTDDEDTVLGGDGHGAMPRGLPALTARGALATNWFVHTPVCACSRSEIMTGRFFHNLLDDSDPEDPWDRHGNSNGPCAPRNCRHLGCILPKSAKQNRCGQVSRTGLAPAAARRPPLLGATCT